MTAFRRVCYFEFTPVGEANFSDKLPRRRFVSTLKPVITGFNTDIPFEGITYHVQTEDKGLDTPLILSLVYVGGAIIASKRTPYEDLIASGYDEKALTERLQRQHKLICAAIRAGRVEDLKRMGGQGDAHESEREGKGKVVTPKGGKSGAGRRRKAEVAPADVQNGHGEVEGISEAASETPQTSDDGIVILTSMMDEISSLGEVEDARHSAFEPTPPVAPHAEESWTDEEETFVPPTSKEHAPLPVELIEAVEEDLEGLYLSLLDDEGDFRAGQLATIKIHVGRGAFGQRPVPDASVTVKVLGTTFRPLIQSAVTDGMGVAVVRALLPRFTSGRAAIIIRAAVGDDAVEMRRIIHQS